MKVHSTLFAVALLCLACAVQTVSTEDTRETAVDQRGEAHIVSAAGYEWPEIDRAYWPTTSWRSAPPEQHGIDPKKLAIANGIAEEDPFFRSLLVVRNGYLIYESYYHGGARDQKTEVWSVTKSFVSALVGIAIDEGHIPGTDTLMADLLPEYPGFAEMTVKNVLTHETGLAWDEGSQETWIQSRDWIAEALGRGFITEPGQALLYSSANSHFLSVLIKETTGISPGTYAEERLFAPLGIEFVLAQRTGRYTSWQQLHEPIDGTWRQDNSGVEIGAFGLRLTGREMANFGFLYLNRGIWEGKAIISEAWVDESIRDHVLRSETVGFGYQWMVVNRSGHIAFDADGWGGQSISVIPALDMVIVTKCDAVNPQGRSSYRVLEKILESVVN
jgi:CubicO group peptidase (beta-lactamase class C family)